MIMYLIGCLLAFLMVCIVMYIDYRRYTNLCMDYEVDWNEFMVIMCVIAGSYLGAFVVGMCLLAEKLKNVKVPNFPKYVFRIKSKCE